MANIAEIAKPLTKLIKKDEPLDWTTECNMSFQRLKNVLTNEPLLIHSDFSKNIILSTVHLTLLKVQY